jgi:hypothetical protein
MTLVGLAADCHAAAAKGVFFEPNNPAGKEYALPLAQARNEASGRGGSDGASGASAPLFGAGISGHGRIAGQGGGKTDRLASPGAKGPGRRESTEGAGPRLGAAAIARLADAGGGYPTMIGAAMVAVIVLLGCGLGLALRGLQRASPV